MDAELPKISTYPNIGQIEQCRTEESRSTVTLGGTNGVVVTGRDDDDDSGSSSGIEASVLSHCLLLMCTCKPATGYEHTYSDDKAWIEFDSTHSFPAIFLTFAKSGL